MTHAIPAGRKVRVLRVIARMNVGGPAVQVTALARGLDGERYDQRLLTGSVDEGEADYLALRAPDVEVVRIPGLGRRISVLDDLRALAAIRAEVRAFRPDIIHTHTAKAGVIGRVAGISVGVPIRVHTFHGHLLHGYFGRWMTKAVVLVERLLALSTTHFVAVGAQVRDDLLAAGIGTPERFTVVPPGVEVHVGDGEAARRELGLPEDVPVIALVARLTAIKCPERFVELASASVDPIPDAVFVVVGDGPLLARLRYQAAPLGDRVRFLGWRGDVETVYAATDVVVLTSINEGMPVSLIEASAAGVPCVATNVGSVAEVVEDGITGTLVSGELAPLVAGVVELFADPERRRAMGLAARARADRLFGSQRLVDDIDHLYCRLLGRPEGGSGP